MPIDPKMLKTKVDYRKWLYPYRDGDYNYGECPKCGEVGSETYDDTVDNVIEEHTFHCADCNIDYTYQTNWNFRFARIEKGY